MTEENTAAATAVLAALIKQVRRTVRQELPPDETANQVAEDLLPYLSRQELLTSSQQTSHPDEYTQHILHVEEDGSFSVVSLVWLPGQRTPIHDHVSWCVVGVHVGEETEIRYEVGAEGDTRFLVPVDVTTNQCRSICGIAPPGDVHEVRNSGASKAISIHVYGADIGRLGSSIRRRYSLPVHKPPRR